MLEIKSYTDLTRVSGCEVRQCSYNGSGQCRAVAITVGGHVTPMCETYWGSKDKGGVEGITGGVGACRQGDCRYNESLECTALGGIKVAIRDGHASCITFSRR